VEEPVREQEQIVGVQATATLKRLVRYLGRRASACNGGNFLLAAVDAACSPRVIVEPCSIKSEQRPRRCGTERTLKMLRSEWGLEFGEAQRITQKSVSA
jgi:hypothetical protein